MISESILCPRCQGYKTIMGMGLLTRPCDVCKEVGFIENPVLKTVKIISEDGSTLTRKVTNEKIKQRGRPKKIANGNA